MVDQALLDEYNQVLEAHDDPARIKELAVRVAEAREAERIAEGRSTAANIGTGTTAEGEAPGVSTNGQEG